MKVLMIHNRYRSALPSGEDRVVDQESAALVDAGHTVEHFERHSDDIAEWSAPRRALVAAQVVWSREVHRSLTEVLQRFQPAVAHVHNTFPLLSSSVLYAAHSERVPVVATLHNYRMTCAPGDLFRDGAVCHDCVSHSPLPGIRHGCYRGSVFATLPPSAANIVHRRAWREMVSAYIFISQAQREILAPGLPHKRLFVKPNFVPRAPHTVAEREHLVVYAGRLTVSKGVDVLMEAWDRHQVETPSKPLRLVLAGSGPLEARVAAWAADREGVEWVGSVSRAAVAVWLGRASAVIVPSRWEETFGLVAVEAMAAGVPPVAAAHGSFPELIHDGVDGVLVEPGDATALATVLNEIVSNPSRFEAMGRAARMTYEQRFTSAISTEHLVQIYEFAIKHPA